MSFSFRTLKNFPGRGHATTPAPTVWCSSSLTLGPSAPTPLQNPYFNSQYLQFCAFHTFMLVFVGFNFFSHVGFMDLVVIDKQYFCSFGSFRTFMLEFVNFDF